MIKDQLAASILLRGSQLVQPLLLILLLRLLLRPLLVLLVLLWLLPM